MSIIGFIKDTKLLEETPKSPDLMEWDALKSIIMRKIKRIRKSSIMAIIGPFGVGKSTMLDKIEKDIKSNRNFWFNFEAWKYPERENLWENFIYDFAIKSEVVTEKDVKEIINGNLRGGKKFIKKVITTLTAMVHADYIGLLFTEDLKESPITRINDYQKLLDTIIKKLNKPIYITIEDIDRSGDKGLFFLETLKNYLENRGTKNRILFLVPISTIHYNEDIDRYLKVINYYEIFQPPHSNFLRLVENLLRDDLKTPNDHLLTAEYLQQYFKKYPETTLRKLKLILRQANIVYKNQSKDEKHPDWRLTLCAEFMKVTKIGTADEKTYYDHVNENNEIPLGTIFSALIAAIYRKDSRLSKNEDFIDSNYDIRTLPKNNNSYDDGIVPSLWL